MTETLYLIGRDAPTTVAGLGWSLLILGVWALCWVAGKWAGGAR